MKWKDGKSFLYISLAVDCISNIFASMQLCLFTTRYSFLRIIMCFLNYNLVPRCLWMVCFFFLSFLCGGGKYGAPWLLSWDIICIQAQANDVCSREMKWGERWMMIDDAMTHDIIIETISKSF